MNAAITDPPATTQVYQVFIRAMPEQIWEAITNPEFTEKYFHGARNEYTGGRRISHGPGRRALGRRGRAGVRPAAAAGAWLAVALRAGAGGRAGPAA